MKAVEAAFASKAATFMNPTSVVGDGDQGIPLELSQEPSRVVKKGDLERKLEEEHEAREKVCLYKPR